MKKELFYRICHASAGCILMYYAIQVIDARDFFHAAFYLAAGLLFLLFAGLHEWVEKRWSKADIVLFLLEAATLFYVASRYYKIQHSKLAYIFAAAGIFFLLLMLSSFSNKRKKHRRQKRKNRDEVEVNNPKPHTGYKMMKDTDDV